MNKGKKNIEVSVICIVYNFEDYIENCLDRILEQKTNFEFEVVIHDDCSTDGSLGILRRYKEKYGDKIVLIEEEENVFSKNNDRLPPDIVLPYVSGKYVAFCEGDDYWCDDHKLQMQYDYMEANPDCSFCCHNVRKFNMRTNRMEDTFFEWDEIRELSPMEALMEWKLQTSSYFLKKEVYEYGKELPIICLGDFAVVAYAFTKGKVVAFPDIMSVYRFSNPKGIVSIRFGTVANFNKSIETVREMEQYLIKYNEITEGKFKDVVDAKIEQINRRCKYYSSKINMTNLLDEEGIGKIMVKYFKDKGWKNIAIYGCGNVGKKMADVLEDNIINCFIDRNVDGYYNKIKIFRMQKLKLEEIENCDVMIITPVMKFDEIKEDILAIGYKGKLINAEEMLVDIANI